MDSIYAVPGSPWIIERAEPDMRAWRIAPSHPIPDAQRKWEVRHRAVYAERFPTLRQAREYVEAILATDPPSSDTSEYHTRLTRLTPGHYRVVATHADRSVEAALTRRKDEQGWELETDSNCLLGYFATLDVAKSRAARVMFEH